MHELRKVDNLMPTTLIAWQIHLAFYESASQPYQVSTIINQLNMYKVGSQPTAGPREPEYDET